MSTVVNSKAPKSDVPKVEKPGAVTSDSLAAESVKSGGDFASNTTAGVSDQPSAGSNLANTDTSSARVIAPDTEALQAQEGWSETAQLNAGANLSSSSIGGKSDNTVSSTGGSTGGNTGGNTSSSSGNNTSGNTGSSNTGSSNTGSGSSGQNSGDAPSYASAVGQNSQPKGKNISEGGVDSDAPNASFNNDIGGENDPGRAALGKFQKSAAEPIVDAGNKSKGSAENSFDALGGETSA